MWNKAAVYSSQRLATKYKAELDKAREDLRKSQSDYNLLRRQQRGGNGQSGTGQQGGGGRTPRKNDDWEKDAEYKKDRDEVIYLSGDFMHVTPNISGMQRVEHSRRLHVWNFLQEETSL